MCACVELTLQEDGLLHTALLSSKHTLGRAEEWMWECVCQHPSDTHNWTTMMLLLTFKSGGMRTGESKQEESVLLLHSGGSGKTGISASLF